MEYWHSNTVLVTESANNRIGVTLYYGHARQYSIRTSEERKGDRDKQIRSILKKLREEKKNINPSHGCTNYV